MSVPGKIKKSQSRTDTQCQLSSRHCRSLQNSCNLYQFTQALLIILHWALRPPQGGHYCRQCPPSGAPEPLGRASRALKVGGWKSLWHPTLIPARAVLSRKPALETLFEEIVTQLKKKRSIESVYRTNPPTSVFVLFLSIRGYLLSGEHCTFHTLSRKGGPRGAGSRSSSGKSSHPLATDSHDGAYQAVFQRDFIFKIGQADLEFSYGFQYFILFAGRSQFFREVLCST